MGREMTRRMFVQTAAAASAALAAPVLAADGEEAVKVALVGAAHIHTPSFINTLKGRKDVKVTSVYDHDAARAKQRADELGVGVVEDPNQIWSDGSVKAVIITSETNRHRDLVLAGARAKKHLFVEKPLGITGAESLEMAGAIEEAKVLFTTGYMSRTFPTNLFIKGQIEQGNLGKITRIRGSMCHEGSIGRWFDTDWRWMADPKVAGCGAFGDLGTHALDILMWLMGDVETVAADIKVVLGNYGDCDESGEGLIKFKNGVTGTLAAGWVDVANPVTLLVSGTEGHAAVINDQLHFRSNRTKVVIDARNPAKEMPARLPSPLEMFLNAVVGKTPAALVTAKEAAARVVVMESMYRAAREKRWVAVG